MNEASNLIFIIHGENIHHNITQCEHNNSNNNMKFIEEFLSIKLVLSVLSKQIYSKIANKNNNEWDNRKIESSSE
jgi:hypothetical protein